MHQEEAQCGEEEEGLVAAAEELPEAEGASVIGAVEEVVGEEEEEEGEAQDLALVMVEEGEETLTLLLVEASEGEGHNGQVWSCGAWVAYPGASHDNTTSIFHQNRGLSRHFLCM